MKPLLFFPGLLLFTGASHAAVLASYNFDAADFTGNDQDATVSGTGLATVSTASNLTFGAGIIEPKNEGRSRTDVLFIDISGQNGSAGNINNTSLGAAFSANDYFQFTVTAVGADLNFESLTFDLENSGGTLGGDGIHLFTSVDGFAAATDVVSSLTGIYGFRFWRNRIHEPEFRPFGIKISGPEFHYFQALS